MCKIAQEYCKSCYGSLFEISITALPYKIQFILAASLPSSRNHLGLSEVIIASVSFRQHTLQNTSLPNVSIFILWLNLYICNKIAVFSMTPIPFPVYISKSIHLPLGLLPSESPKQEGQCNGKQFQSCLSALWACWTTYSFKAVCMFVF